MAYVRKEVTDGVTIMDKDLYDNLQDGIEETKGDLENVKESIEEAEDTILNVQDQIEELGSQIDTATNIAKGRNRAKVFSTTEKMQEWLSNPENKNLCIIGDNLYIVDTDVPDWWIAEVLNEVDQETGYFYKIAQLETQKVDLTTIEEELDYLNQSLNGLMDYSSNTEEDLLIGQDGSLGLNVYRAIKIVQVQNGFLSFQLASNRVRHILNLNAFISIPQNDGEHIGFSSVDFKNSVVYIDGHMNLNITEQNSTNPIVVVTMEYVSE